MHFKYIIYLFNFLDTLIFLYCYRVL